MSEMPVDQASPPGSADPPPEDEVYESKSSRSTHFVFHHKLFALPDAVFRTGIDKTQVLEVKLGEHRAALPLSTVRAEFSIDDPGRADSDMMAIVEKGLRYVREIRPGDSIPRELLDGTASWSVDQRHTMIARGRVIVQLVSWLNGEEAVVIDLAQLEQVSNDPLVGKQVGQAILEVCKKLGIPPARQNIVAERIEGLARELAYIEALRDYAGKVSGINEKLKKFSRLYHRDVLFWPELQRMKALIGKPIEQINSYFDQVDSQTSKILIAIKNYNATVNFIRDIRDEIHGALMDWDLYIKDMEELPLERLRAHEAVLRKLYGFLARTFPQSREWPLFMKAIKSSHRAAAPEPPNSGKPSQARTAASG
jgi:hypothetical protein